MTNYMLLLNLLVDGIALGCIYALLAVGFSLLWWVAGIVHVAHGAVMLAGGFALFSAFEMAGINLYAAIAFGLVAAMLLGVMFERFMYRPLIERGTDEMGILTASLGALIFVEYALTIVFGPEGATLDAGKLRTPIFPGGLIVDRYSILLLVVTLAIFFGLWFVLSTTRIGREMRAVASNADLAKVLGIEARTIQLVAAAIAAGLCVPPAAFLLFSTGLVPADALHIVLVASVVAILGGRGSLTGALVAGLLIGIAESAMTWRFAAGWRQLITFSLLYFLLLVRPQGLFGERI